MALDEIERDALIETDVEHVWTLLTHAEHIGGWFGDAGAHVDLRVGGELVVHWEEHGAVHARFEAIDKPSILAFRWAPFAHPGGTEPVPGNSTLVTFLLLPEGVGTRVKVVESGFASLDCSRHEQRQHAARNGEGWDLELRHLGDLANREIIFRASTGH